MLDKLLVNVIPITVLFGLGIANTYEDNTVYTTANILIQSYSKSRMEGFFVEKGDKRNVVGNIFYISNIDWCSRLPSLVVKEIPSKPWIAIIRATNNCSCMKKLSTAKEYNATAAILSPAGPSEKHCDESHIDEKVGEIPTSVLLNKKDHNKIIKHYLQQKVPKIECTITKGKNVVEKQFKVSRTSILFVLVSFILLMCISLAWLVFYYVQRFRHIYRNDRKEKQLLSAAKKAISKLKTISFQAGSTKDEEDDSCAVCLENYKDGENIRVLPCKHLFHKSCIDPWLLNHRTCPMCKSNILKSLGVEIPDNIDLSQFDVESRRVSRDHDTVQSTPALPAAPAEEASVDEHHHHHAVPSTSVFTAGDSSSQAWSEPNVVSASCCSSTSSMLSDTDSERSTVALVSVVQKV